MNLPDVIPWSTTGTFTLGLIAVLVIIGVVLNVVVAAKKLFGRTPPLTEELDKRDRQLRKLIFSSEANLKERMSRLEERHEQMQVDRERKWGQLQREISELAVTMSYLRGKAEEAEKRRTNL